jgi:hypothetical protein
MIKLINSLLNNIVEKVKLREKMLLSFQIY